MSKLLYLEAPYGHKLKVNSAFLAGGITNCPNWQEEVLEELRDLFPKFGFINDICIMNPRRKHFDISKKEESSIQILWEYQSINYHSNVFSIWFSEGPSDQPITLFELGAALYKFEPENICIGLDPGYKRAFDVETQVRLKYPSKKIVTTKKEHAINILKALKRFDN